MSLPTKSGCLSLSRLVTLLSESVPAEFRPFFCFATFAAQVEEDDVTTGRKVQRTVADPIAFLYGSLDGAAASLFSDFGPEFTVS